MAQNGSFVKKYCENELILCEASSLLMKLFVKKCDHKDDGGTCMLLSDACVTDEGGLEHIRIYTSMNIGRADKYCSGFVFVVCRSIDWT